MDRFNDTSESQNSAGLQKPQIDAVSQKTQTEEGGVAKFCAEAIHSAAYAGLQEPVTGLSQLVDKFAGTHFQPNLQFISAPEQTKFGTAEWHAQQIGGAAGSLLPFLLVRKGVRGVIGTEEAGVATTRASFGMSMKEAAVTGFAYDFLLKPSQLKDDASKTDMLLDRAIHGTIGAGTFATMTAAGLGLRNLAGASAVENTILSTALKNPIANGALSGIPAAFVNAEGNSLAKNGQLASTSELGQAAYSMSLMGAGFGLAHSLKGAESTTTRVETKSNPLDNLKRREGLALAAGDTIGGEGAKYSVEPKLLSIPAKQFSLTDLGKRVSGVEQVTEGVRVAKPGETKDFSSDREFFERNTEVVDTPMRVYSMEGLKTQIFVPEAYAKQLDAVRQFRLGLEGGSPEGTQPIEPGLLRRALPEDFIPYLDALPNKNMVRRLYLSDKDNPTDPVFQKAIGDKNFKSQTDTDQDVITFYKKDADPYMGHELRHEWSHIARNEQPGISSTFDLAAKHEGKNYIPRERALDDPEEYSAVLMGEEFISPDANRFLKLTQEAPLQTVALAESLKDAMRTAPPIDDTNRASFEAYNSRLDYIDKVVRPQAVAKLQEDLGNTQVSSYANTAARLLVRLGEIDKINAAKDLKSLDLSGDPVGAATLKELKNNRSIQDLNLSNTYVGENGLSFLEGMPLKSLNLSSTRTSGSSLRALESISTLRNLDLSGTAVNDGAIMAISRLSRLQNLNLQDSQLSPKAIDWLRAKMPDTNIEF